MSFDDCKALLKKYCNFLVDSYIECADFRFTDLSSVFGMLSFISNSYILIDDKFGLRINDIGSGDVSPKFEHILFLVRHSKDEYGRVLEYLPFNMSIDMFLRIFDELYEKDFYLILDKTKIGEALKNDDNFYVVIEPLSMGGEDFFGYLGGLHLKEKGYFITKWNPLGGSDFFAYKIPEYTEILHKFEIINKGAFLIELMLYPYIKPVNKSSYPLLNEKYDTIVCEVEARYNLALYSNAGIGQKRYWIDTHHVVYGVGPVNYIPKSENIHEYFGERVGAILFTDDLKKIEIEPIKHGFMDENYEIQAIKRLIKSIFLNKLHNLARLSIRDYIHKIDGTSLEEIVFKIIDSG